MQRATPSASLSIGQNQLKAAVAERDSARQSVATLEQRSAKAEGVVDTVKEQVHSLLAVVRLLTVSTTAGGIAVGTRFGAKRARRREKSGGRERSIVGQSNCGQRRRTGTGQANPCSSKGCFAFRLGNAERIHEAIGSGIGSAKISSNNRKTLNVFHRFLG